MRRFIFTILALLLSNTLIWSSGQHAVPFYKFLAGKAALEIENVYRNLHQAINILFEEDEFGGIRGQAENDVKKCLLCVIQAIDELCLTTDPFTKVKDCMPERAFILEALRMINQKIRTQLLKMETFELRKGDQKKPKSDCARIIKSLSQNPSCDTSSIHMRGGILTIAPKSFSSLIAEYMRSNSIIEELVRVLFMFTALGEALSHDISPHYRAPLLEIDLAIFNISGLGKEAIDTNRFLQCLHNIEKQFFLLREHLNLDHKINSHIRKILEEANTLLLSLKNAFRSEEREAIHFSTAVSQKEALYIAKFQQCMKALYRALRTQNAALKYEPIYRQKKYSEEIFLDVPPWYRDHFIGLNDVYCRMACALGVSSSYKGSSGLDDNDGNNEIQTPGELRTQATRILTQLKSVIEARNCNQKFVMRYIQNINDFFTILGHSSDLNDITLRASEYIMLLKQELNMLYEALRFKTQRYQIPMLEGCNVYSRNPNHLYTNVLHNLFFIAQKRTCSQEPAITTYSHLNDFCISTIQFVSSLFNTEQDVWHERAEKIERLQKTLAKVKQEIDIPDAIAGLLQARHSSKELKLIEYCLQNEFLPTKLLGIALWTVAPDKMRAIQKQLDDGIPISRIAEELSLAISFLNLDKPADSLAAILTKYKEQVSNIGDKTTNFGISFGHCSCKKIENGCHTLARALSRFSSQLGRTSLNQEAWYFWCNGFSATTSFCAQCLRSNNDDGPGSLLFSAIDEFDRSSLMNEERTVDDGSGLLPLLEHDRDQQDVLYNEENEDPSGIPFLGNSLSIKIFDEEILENIDRRRVGWIHNILLDIFKQNNTDDAMMTAGFLSNSMQSIFNYLSINRYAISKRLKEQALQVKLLNAAHSTKKEYEVVRNRWIESSFVLKQMERFQRLNDLAGTFGANNGAFTLFQKKMLAKEQELWRRWLLKRHEDSFKDAENRYKEKEAIHLKSRSELEVVQTNLETVKQMELEILARNDALRKRYRYLFWLIGYFKRRPYFKALDKLQQTEARWTRSIKPLKNKEALALRAKSAAERNKDFQYSLLQNVKKLSSSYKSESPLEHLTRQEHDYLLAKDTIARTYQAIDP